MCELGMITQERLNIDVSANRKSYVPRRLAQQLRMTLSDLASRAVSVVAELLVITIIIVMDVYQSGAVQRVVYLSGDTSRLH